MAVIEQSIDVKAPIRTVYDQWTQFEDFPRFMESVEQVHQVDDTTLEWHARIAGVERSWRAKILDQTPDRRIAWVSTDGARNDGVVTFSDLGPAGTRVNLHLDVAPTTPLETAGTALGVVDRTVQGDLERFRDFLEARMAETAGRGHG